MTSTQAKQPLFLPKLWTCLQSYSPRLFWGDLTAGVIVGIVALPLAIAFAIASGVPPERGLITAIVAGFLISTLGGSRVQIGGPTGAFVIIVFNIVQRYGMDGLILCTLMAGFILIGMGLLQLGSFIRFIPYPLTVGFTSGIAVVIFSSQIKDFLGLSTGPLSGDTVHNWLLYARNIGTAQLPTLGLSALSLAILILWPRVNRRVPGPIVALITATLIAQLFHLPVETIDSRFGGIPSGLPRPTWPALDLGAMRGLISPAFTVALLCAIESLLSATVADGMIEGRHRSNTELIAQGIANIFSPLFGGMPATGAIARTATNVRNGGRTPVAGIIHALTLLLIMLLFGRWAQLIPLCVLSAILIVVAYHMSEWHAFRALLKAPRMDVAVLVTTFGLTVLVDLTVAVEVGLMLAMLLFMQRMTDVTTVRQVTNELQNQSVDETALRAEADAISKRVVPAGVEVYEAEGAFFFGIAESLRDAMAFGKNPPRAVILRMRHVLVIDASALRALRDLNQRCRRSGAALILAGIHAQPLIAMEQSGLLEEFGEENVVSSIDQALTRAQQILRSP